MAVEDTEEHAPVLTVTEARQGLRGRHMVWVLGISMALVIVGMGSLWLAHAPSLSGPGGQTATTANLQHPQAGQAHPDAAATATPGVGQDGKGL